MPLFRVTEELFQDFINLSLDETYFCTELYIWLTICIIIQLYLGKSLILTHLAYFAHNQWNKVFYFNIKLSSRYLLITFAKWSFGLVLNGVIALCWMVGVLRHSGPLLLTLYIFQAGFWSILPSDLYRKLFRTCVT